MNPVNKELMRKILTQVEENPEQHDQSQWSAQTRCGTAFCVAGWACFLSGYEPVFPGDKIFETSSEVEKDGELFQTSEKAMELLSLSPEEANQLFYSTEETAIRLLREWSA